LIVTKFGSEKSPPSTTIDTTKRVVGSLGLLCAGA
jgi:hypothetical protein